MISTTAKSLPRVLLALAVAASLLLVGSGSAVAAEAFSDVDDSDTFSDEIQQLFELGITTGFDVEGEDQPEFRPNLEITRQAVIAFAYDVAGSPDGPFPDPEFSDVEEGDPFYTEISWAEENEITDGFPDGTFRPNENVTREAFTAFVFRLAGEPMDEDDTEDFSDYDCDGDSDDDAFCDAVEWASTNGVVNGFPDGTFRPTNDITREAVAALLVRAINEGFIGQGLVGQDTATDGPELLSAELVEQNAETADVLFTFDEDVDGRQPVSSCFHLYPFDLSDVSDGGDDDDACLGTDTSSGGHAGDVNANPSSYDGVNSFVDTDEPNTVLVRFNIDEDEFDAVTVATVDWDAVRDAEGTENLEGDAPIQDVTFNDGETTAPDLIDVDEFDADAETVDFVFDEDIATLNLDTESFFLVEEDGTVETSSSAVISEDDEDTVTVTFDDISEDQEEDTVRAGVQAQAVSDDEGQDSPTQAIAVTGDGDTDNKPNLVSVDVDDDDDTATFRFDRAVDPADLNGDDFNLYDRTGEEIEGTMDTPAEDDGVEDGSTSNTVLVNFPEDSDLDELVGASVEEGAVETTTGIPAMENAIDSVALAGESFDAGSTVGPDLIGARVEQSTQDGGFGQDDTSELHIIYEFDEDVTLAMADDVPTTGGTDSAAGRFFLYDQDGTPTRAATCQAESDEVALADNEIACQFGDDSDDAISDALAATVNDFAVESDDDEGEFNIEGFSVLEQLDS